MKLPVQLQRAMAAEAEAAREARAKVMTSALGAGFGFSPVRSTPFPLKPLWIQKSTA